jgi:hypothetical protein
VATSILFGIVVRKNIDFVQTHSSDLFNSIIHTLGLREIYMHGGNFTWSNNHASPALDKLERILMSPDWEDFFPLVTVRKLVRKFLIIMPYYLTLALTPLL